MSCGACEGRAIRCFLCRDALDGRLKAAAAPLVGDRNLNVAVAELARLTTDAKRVARDIADAFESGRLAAIRADVAYHLPYFRKEARAWQFVAERSAAEARYMAHVDPPTQRCELFTEVDRRLAAGQQERSARDAGRARAACEAFEDVARWLEATR